MSTNHTPTTIEQADELHRLREVNTRLLEQCRASLAFIEAHAEQHKDGADMGPTAYGLRAVISEATGGA